MTASHRVRFHHLGVASQSFARDTAAYSVMGYACEGPDYTDPLLGVKCRFLAGPGPRIELVEDLPDSKVVAPWIARGIRIYHQAFFVSDLDAVIASYTSTTRGRVVVPPTPAVAFQGARVSFLAFPGLELFEFIEDFGHDHEGASITNTGDGVASNRGLVVGAGSVVTSDVARDPVVAGNPAHPMKSLRS